MGILFVKNFLSNVMTCIVGLVDKNNRCVIIGGDSAGVSPYHDCTIRKDEKVFFNGDFLIGGTTSFRMLNILRYCFKPPIIDTSDIYRYMCTKFIGEIRKVFSDEGFMQKNDEGKEVGGNFLVAYKDRLFVVLEDFQVGENLNGMATVGSGREYAIGALSVLINQKQSCFDSVQKSLEVASMHSTSVCGPYIILNTENV